MNTLALFKRERIFFQRNSDLSFVELMILKRIAISGRDKCPEEVRVSALNDVMHATKPAISQSLNNLEKKGLISRNISAGDRRAIALTMTDKGKKVYSEKSDEMNSYLDQIVEKFGLENTKTLIALLKRLAEIIDEIRANPISGKR